MKKRVLLCSMDGVRPDAILSTETPTIDRLAREGAFTWSARTVMPSSTLPCHTSMLRGVPTERHGITSNTFTPIVRPVPSLIDAARAQGRRTGFFYNWEQLRDLADPGSLHVAVMHGECTSEKSDAFLAEQACAYLERDDLDLLFLYLGWPDECGHKHGWMTPPYLESITHADACLGRVLETLRRLGRETVTLVVSDHGGHDRSHGTDRPEDMTIPWVLNGPGVRAGVEIATPVRIYDTCPTLAHLLGLSPAPQWEGRIVTDALEPDAISA
ncbi:MAG: alkaline phosphatase family protein [Capsulimonadales bacterium]|nr:alkaline phosphatase family protein [Capsulimonadales bacterium]